MEHNTRRLSIDAGKAGVTAEGKKAKELPSQIKHNCVWFVKIIPCRRYQAMPERNAQDDVRVTKRSMYYWVWNKNAKLQMVLMAIIVVTVATRVFPLEMQKQIINEAIGKKNLHLLFMYCGLYMAAVFMAQGLKYVIYILQSYIGERSLLDLRVQLIEHILRLPMSFFRRTSPGLVISSLTNELIHMPVFIGSAISQPLVNILTFIAMAGYMFYLNPILGAISIVIYPAEFTIIPKVQRKFNRWNQRRIQKLRKVSSLVGEAITGVHEVHGNASQPLEVKKIQEGAEELYTANLWMNIYKFGIKFVNNFFQSLGPFSLFLIGGYLAIKGQFDIGALVAFLSAYEKLYDPWKELMEFYQVYQDSKVRYAQVMDYFDLEPEHDLAPKGRKPYALRGQIEVQDLSYVVAGNIKLLDKINLSLKPGEHLALVGFSGSGKSSLALVVGQLYKYTGGNVLIDGNEVEKLSKQDMAFNMGIVAQHPFIFEGTVKENLLYSCESVSLHGGKCAGRDELPDLDRIIETVQQVGLFLDVLRFGLRERLDMEANKDLVQNLINARMNFQARHGEEVKDDVEFFGQDEFLLHSNMAVNLTFGAPNDPAFNHEVLHVNDVFLAFLDQENIRHPLLELGSDMARRSIDIVRSLGQSPEVFEDLPVPRDEIEVYIKIVEHLEKADLDGIDDKDKELLLKLALRYEAGHHKLVAVSSAFMKQVVETRQHFKDYIEDKAMGAFTFYRMDAYIISANILDNIIFGHIKSDSAGAEERVNQQVMQLLIEENVLERVVEIGLDFNVGSMGDHLSGGQRQKVALARAFLKEPPMLILDEATSALDNASQTRIQNLLERKWKGRSTLIAVVHRLDTLRGYDKIAVMKAGKIIEMGSYQELIDQKGALYDLIHGKAKK